MSKYEYEESLDILARILDSSEDHPFGNNDFTISELRRADDATGGYLYTYTQFLGESQEYRAQSIDELYGQLIRIYTYPNKPRAAKRLLDDLNEALSD